MKVSQMQKVFCPKANGFVWANYRKKTPDDGLFRCTKCGELHSREGRKG